jgi:Protein of unknown function (DUF1365)
MSNVFGLCDNIEETPFQDSWLSSLANFPTKVSALSPLTYRIRTGAWTFAMCATRATYDLRGLAFDVLLFVLIERLFYRPSELEALQVPNVFLLGCIGFAFGLIPRLIKWSFTSTPRDPTSTYKTEFDATKFIEKPMFYGCRTVHTRMTPKVHSFKYSYLFVGIPIGYRNTIGSLVDLDAGAWKNPFTWFQVNADDYLSRVNGLSLKEKLDTFLVSEVRLLFFLQFKQD